MSERRRDECPQCGTMLEPDGSCFNGCLAEVVSMPEPGKRARRKQDTAPGASAPTRHPMSPAPNSATHVGWCSSTVTGSASARVAAVADLGRRPVVA